MPIYEYICNKCGKCFSLLKMSGRDEGASCASCGSSDVKKTISSFSCGQQGSVYANQGAASGAGHG